MLPSLSIISSIILEANEIVSTNSTLGYTSLTVCGSYSLRAIKSLVHISACVVNNGLQTSQCKSFNTLEAMKPPTYVSAACRFKISTLNSSIAIYGCSFNSLLSVAASDGDAVTVVGCTNY